MAKKRGGDEWWKAALWLVGGALFLYGVKVATDEEKSGITVPADPGGRIDLLVQELNVHFGKQWVQFGLNAIQAYLEKKLPKPVVELVGVIYAVEEQSTYMPIPMGGYYKKQVALNMIGERRI
jgi:hypothetical protein